MTEKLALILLDAKPNRHSLNALVGALETDRELDNLELRLPAGETRLRQDISEVIGIGKRPIVGISFTTSQLERVRTMVPQNHSPAVWIAGGPHPTANPERTLGMGFDVVVRGEGEGILLQLLKTIAAQEDLASIPGVTVASGVDGTRSEGTPPPVDLDVFPPFPLWRRRVVGPIEITRGCPFACGYCQTSHLMGLRPRHRGIETVARYAAVIRKRGLRDVRFVASDAFAYGSSDGKALNLPALESLLAAVRQAIGREGRLFFGTFPSEVRPEHVNDATLDLVKRYADNDSLIIGAQTGSDQLLQRCRRGHSATAVLSAVSRTVAAGLTPHVDFIFGLPGETDEDVIATVEVIRELVAMRALIHAHTFMPLPQTSFAGQAPGRICGSLRLLIRELAHRGVLYGIWHKQLREGQRIAESDRGFPELAGPS